MKVIAVYLGFSSNLLIVGLGTCVTKIADEELFSMNNSETQQGFDVMRQLSMSTPLIY